MLRTRLTILAFAVLLFAGKCAVDYSHADANLGAVDRDQLQGNWRIVSVHKDGQPDLTQVGAILAFTGNRVEFHSRHSLGIEDFAISLKRNNARIIYPVEMLEPVHVAPIFDGTY